MYTAEITISHQLTKRVFGVHKVENAASAADAYNAALMLSSNVEQLYPCYQEVEIKVFHDGQLVDENEYAECWRMGE